MENCYRIEHDQPGRRWRVWWVGPIGFVRSHWFQSGRSALEWVNAQPSLETLDQSPAETTTSAEEGTS